MTGWRRLVGRAETRVLPFTGGSHVSAADRRVRLAARPIAPGWYRFTITGRTATADAPADIPDLADRPIVRGHTVGTWLFPSGRTAVALRLCPEEPPLLSPVRGRTWHSGETLFEGVDFESEVEDAARRRLESRAALGDLPGVPPSLRAAFGFALAKAIADDRGLRVSPLEVLPAAVSIADAGAIAADAFLSALEDTRRRELERRGPTPVVTTNEPRPIRPSARIEGALEAAGADVLGVRQLEGGNVEVTYSFLGERFVSVADARTLRIVDAGICLSGADDRLTLESLPAAIREAIDTHVLHVTRW